MKLNRVPNNSYRMLRFESLLFTCLTYRNVQRFRNGPVRELYGLKASKVSKVRASSHEYPHVEISKIFGNRIENFKGTAQAPQAQNTWCMRQLVHIENW